MIASENRARGAHRVAGSIVQRRVLRIETPPHESMRPSSIRNHGMHSSPRVFVSRLPTTKAIPFGTEKRACCESVRTSMSTSVDIESLGIERSCVCLSESDQSPR